MWEEELVPWLVRFTALANPPESFADFPPLPVPAFVLVHDFIKSVGTWLHMFVYSTVLGGGGGESRKRRSSVQQQQRHPQRRWETGQTGGLLFVP